MSEALQLSPRTIEALAELVAERLREDGAVATLVSAAEIARRFNVSRDYVYEHASELGAVRLGESRRAPLRFDPRAVAARLAAVATPAIAEKKRTPRPSQAASRAPLLPVREGGHLKRRSPPTGEPSAKDCAHAQTADLPRGNRG